MNVTFMANTHHEVKVKFDIACHLTVTDLRTNAVFSGALTLEKYNEAVDFVKENDHGNVVNLLNQKYPF